MEITPEQKTQLLNTKRTADHLFRWVYDVIHSGNISLKQYNILIKIHDMHPSDQKGYILHEDVLYPVPTRVKKYQLTPTGWEQRKLLTPKRNRPKTYKKHKKDK